MTSAQGVGVLARWVAKKQNHKQPAAAQGPMRVSDFQGGCPSECEGVYIVHVSLLMHAERFPMHAA